MTSLPNEAETRALAPVYAAIREIAERLRREQDSRAVSHEDWTWLPPEERP